MLRYLIVFLLWMSVLTFNADAMRISPLVLEVSPAGVGSSGRIRVENTSTEDMPIDIQVFSISVGEDGSVEQVPADDDFFVFPPQVVIPAGEQQVIRVQWLGDPDPAMSKAFFVMINELPIDLEEGASAVQFVYSIAALVNVVPSGAKAENTITSSEIIELPEGQKAIRVSVRNDGTKFFQAGAYTWRLNFSDAEPYIIDGTVLTEAIGLGFVPPGGGVRVLEVPLPAEVSGTFTNVDLVNQQ